MKALSETKWTELESGDPLSWSYHDNIQIFSTDSNNNMPLQRLFALACTVVVKIPFLWEVRIIFKSDVYIIYIIYIYIYHICIIHLYLV